MFTKGLLKYFSHEKMCLRTCASSKNCYPCEVFTDPWLSWAKSDCARLCVCLLGWSIFAGHTCPNTHFLIAFIPWKKILAFYSFHLIKVEVKLCCWKIIPCIAQLPNICLQHTTCNGEQIFCLSCHFSEKKTEEVASVVFENLPTDSRFISVLADPFYEWRKKNIFMAWYDCFSSVSLVWVFFVKQRLGQAETLIELNKLQNMWADLSLCCYMFYCVLSHFLFSLFVCHNIYCMIKQVVKQYYVI